MSCRRRTLPRCLAFVLVVAVMLVDAAGPASPAQAAPAWLPGADPSTPTISLPDVHIPEGTDPNVIFFRSQRYSPIRQTTLVATLSQPASQPVSVNWATAPIGTFVSAVGGVPPGPPYPGPCTDSVDYVTANGTIDFSPGVTFAIFTVSTCADDSIETNEPFLIQLSNPTGGAQLERTSAVVTIDNDDGTPSLSIDDAQPGEQTTSPTTAVLQPFTINVSPNFKGHATVDYTTVDGTATGGTSCGQPGVDYISSSGTVQVFSAPVTITVPVCSDSTYEPDETFTIHLSNATSGMQLTRSAATVTIANDDPPPAACEIRPTVQRQTSVIGPGRMQVTVRSTTSPGTPSNPLNALAFDRLANASVEINGQAPATQPFTATLTGQPTEASFIVNRVAPGPVTVQLRIQDSCGSWPTFVGAGASGF